MGDPTKSVCGGSNFQSVPEDSADHLMLTDSGTRGLSQEAQRPVDTYQTLPPSFRLPSPVILALNLFKDSPPTSLQNGGKGSTNFEWVITGNSYNSQSGKNDPGHYHIAKINIPKIGFIEIKIGLYVLLPRKAEMGIEILDLSLTTPSGNIIQISKDAIRIKKNEIVFETAELIFKIPCKIQGTRTTIPPSLNSISLENKLASVKKSDALNKQLTHPPRIALHLTEESGLELERAIQSRTSRLIELKLEGRVEVKNENPFTITPSITVQGTVDESGNFHLIDSPSLLVWGIRGTDTGEQREQFEFRIDGGNLYFPYSRDEAKMGALSLIRLSPTDPLFIFNLGRAPSLEDFQYFRHLTLFSSEEGGHYTIERPLGVSREDLFLLFTYPPSQVVKDLPRDGIVGTRYSLHEPRVQIGKFLPSVDDRWIFKPDGSNIEQVVSFQMVGDAHLQVVVDEEATKSRPVEIQTVSIRSDQTDSTSEKKILAEDSPPISLRMLPGKRGAVLVFEVRVGDQVFSLGVSKPSDSVTYHPVKAFSGQYESGQKLNSFEKFSKEAGGIWLKLPNGERLLLSPEAFAAAERKSLVNDFADLPLASTPPVNFKYSAMRIEPGITREEIGPVVLNSVEPPTAKNEILIDMVEFPTSKTHPARLELLPSPFSRAGTTTSLQETHRYQLDWTDEDNKPRKVNFTIVRDSVAPPPHNVRVSLLNFSDSPGRTVHSILKDGTILLSSPDGNNPRTLLIPSDLLNELERVDLPSLSGLKRQITIIPPNTNIEEVEEFCGAAKGYFSTSGNYLPDSAAGTTNIYEIRKDKLFSLLKYFLQATEKLGSNDVAKGERVPETDQPNAENPPSSENAQAPNQPPTTPDRNEANSGDQDAPLNLDQSPPICPSSLETTLLTSEEKILAKFQTKIRIAILTNHFPLFPFDETILERRRGEIPAAYVYRVYKSLMSVGRRTNSLEIFNKYLIPIFQSTFLMVENPEDYQLRTNFLRFDTYTSGRVSPYPTSDFHYGSRELITYRVPPRQGRYQNRFPNRSSEQQNYYPGSFNPALFSPPQSNPPLQPTLYTPINALDIKPPLSSTQVPQREIFRPFSLALPAIAETPRDHPSVTNIELIKKNKTGRNYDYAKDTYQVWFSDGSRLEIEYSRLRNNATEDGRRSSIIHPEKATFYPSVGFADQPIELPVELRGKSSSTIVHLPRRVEDSKGYILFIHRSALIKAWELKTEASKKIIATKSKTIRPENLPEEFLRLVEVVRIPLPTAAPKENQEGVVSLNHGGTVKFRLDLAFHVESLRSLETAENLFRYELDEKLPSSTPVIIEYGNGIKGEALLLKGEINQCKEIQKYILRLSDNFSLSFEVRTDSPNNYSLQNVSLRQLNAFGEEVSISLNTKTQDGKLIAFDPNTRLSFEIDPQHLENLERNLTAIVIRKELIPIEELARSASNFQLLSSRSVRITGDQTIMADRFQLSFLDGSYLHFKLSRTEGRGGYTSTTNRATLYRFVDGKFIEENLDLKVGVGSRDFTLTLSSEPNVERGSKQGIQLDRQMLTEALHREGGRMSAPEFQQWIRPVVLSSIVETDVLIDEKESSKATLQLIERNSTNPEECIETFRLRLSESEWVEIPLSRVLTGRKYKIPKDPTKDELRKALFYSTNHPKGIEVSLTRRGNNGQIEIDLQDEQKRTLIIQQRLFADADLEPGIVDKLGDAGRISESPIEIQIKSLNLTSALPESETLNQTETPKPSEPAKTEPVQLNPSFQKPIPITIFLSRDRNGETIQGTIQYLGDEVANPLHQHFRLLTKEGASFDFVAKKGRPYQLLSVAISGEPINQTSLGINSLGSLTFSQGPLTAEIDPTLFRDLADREPISPIYQLITLTGFEKTAAGSICRETAELSSSFDQPIRPYETFSEWYTKLKDSSQKEKIPKDSPLDLLLKKIGIESAELNNNPRIAEHLDAIIFTALAQRGDLQPILKRQMDIVGLLHRTHGVDIDSIRLMKLYLIYHHAHVLLDKIKPLEINQLVKDFFTGMTKADSSRDPSAELAKIEILAKGARAIEDSLTRRDDKKDRKDNDAKGVK